MNWILTLELLPLISPATLPGESDKAPSDFLSLRSCALSTALEKFSFAFLQRLKI